MDTNRGKKKKRSYILRAEIYTHHTHSSDQCGKDDCSTPHCPHQHRPTHARPETPRPTKTDLNQTRFTQKQAQTRPDHFKHILLYLRPKLLHLRLGKTTLDKFNQTRPTTL
ncbi:hypothetical protein E2C01_080040 [Portunus trituberculatus]|uniref:Uncharacterized protein n=1 Tax=Portunus trituberculatus TaxID=210409 RepID=A0A5B7IYH2_PORTR|nr:hypothetical protein [Portunus trituberculatus]